ncbi:unnamed protein product [Penicillium nalgiovense]|uniref:Uncharacterized protein n=1 Tax=Penicillium nalgiovense TaxID=60175 RepID=A0A9W4NCZ9_PENNA|nr:unnamed protein product [Penicillium nalgiovense]CAG7940956.1 unnamed protein product [Penicillium nalgiovense]CAG7944001.1 unnamed protein product [Penicillium nalgiovense]CAG7956512.1 unnamed protein product [Penicillium nalgiovense]CAG7996208.1 unnamed protein product [Penicillium nalgiovense]
MPYTVIFWFFFLLFGALRRNADTVMAELVRLAEQKGAAVMNNVASNLIWMFVVCLIAWKAVTFLFWLMQRLCDRIFQLPMMACGYYCRLAQGWLAMTLGAACALFQH